MSYLKRHIQTRRSDRCDTVNDILGFIGLQTILYILQLRQEIVRAIHHQFGHKGVLNTSMSESSLSIVLIEVVFAVDQSLSHIG